MKQEEYYFIEQWKKEMISKIQLAHPEWKKKKLDEYLDNVIEKNLKDPRCVIHNSYKDKTANTSLLNTIEFIHRNQPILGGYGVMFQNQNQVYNPAAHMLLDSINKRKKLKKERKKYDKRSYQFLVLDIAQGNEKVIANSFYGANGTKTSTFYNRDLASSITATGQAEIATAETSFESLMSNNTKFFDMDEAILYIDRIIKEEYEYEIPKLKDAKEKAFEKVRKTMMYQNKFNEELMMKIFNHLSEEDCVKIYYKNNIIEFLRDYKPARKILKDVINNTKEFRNPNEVPEDILPKLEELWNCINCFVVYNYTVRNRIERDKYHPRLTCVTQDTDSTMLTLLNIKNFMVDEFADDEVAAETQDDFDFIMINIICYLLTNYSHVFFERYCTDVHIPEEYHWMINMKNEFYYPILLDTDSKKHYITLTKLQEGVEIKPPKIEIHGLEMAKAETSEVTKDFFFNIIQDDIMYTDKIDVAKIIRKVKGFEHTIHDSLASGKLEFLPLKSVKEMAAYDMPFSEQGIRAACTWNWLYPDMQINLPDKFLALSIACRKKKVFDEIRGIPENYRRIIEDKIFNSDEKSLRTAGFNIIAIPQNLDAIPDWLIPLIDYDKMIEDNVSKFNAILKSLGSLTLKTRSTSNHMTNIISF